MTTPVGPVEREPLGAWRWTTRVMFRFCFIYIPLFFFSLIPNPILDRAIPWIGTHLLGVTTIITGGSDTIYDYLRVLCCLAVAAVGTAVWSALDTRRSHYDVLHRWLRYFVRLVLVLAMSIYGWDKVLFNQMPAPGPDTLLTPFGQASRFDLLWTFMGASKPYQFFTGAAELLAGAMLFIPRFTLMGAILCLGVMANVFLLNMSYAVPVKILSFHLLLLSVVLIAPDARRLTNVFVLNRPAPPARPFAVSSRPWIRRTWAAVLGVLMTAGLVLTLVVSSVVSNAFSAAAARSIHGMWSVDEFTEDGGGAPRFTGNARWQRLMFLHRNYAQLQLADGSLDGLTLTFDEQRKAFGLADDGNTQIPALPKVWHSQFTFEFVDPRTLTITGRIEGRGVHATLHALDVSTFPLTSTPFRWTSDPR